MSPRKAKTPNKETEKVTVTRNRRASKTEKTGTSREPRASEHGNGRPTEDVYVLVSKRAYELYVQRGAQPGHDFEDWLEAERQVLHAKG